MSVSYGGDSIVFADSSVQSSGWTGFKNRIINGGMVIDQRNAGASVTVGTGAFSVDRFRSVEVTDGTATAQQSSIAPAGFSNSLLYTVTGTDASLGSTQYASVEQRIEGFNIADLGWGTASAKDVTISFWVRSSVTGTYCVGLYNSSGARSYTAEYTISSANTWEQKTITVVGDTTGTWLTTNGIGVLVSFTLAVGSSYQQTAGSWGSTSFAIGTSNQINLMATNGATFYITGVQLERGSTASSFEYRPYGTELALCQRYYAKSYETSTVPGTATALGIPTVGIYANGIFTWQLSVPFPVQMRAAPSSVSYWDAAGTVSRTSYLGNGTTTFNNGVNVSGTPFNFSSSGFTFNYNASTTGTYFAHWAATAEL
jgi:hypothetical protein